SRSSVSRKAVRSFLMAMTTCAPDLSFCAAALPAGIDRVEDHEDHYLIRPTINRMFKPAEFSTISDHRDNVHWFKSESGTGLLFNIHVNGYHPSNPKVPNRVYVDPEGEKVAGDLILATKISA